MTLQRKHISEIFHFGLAGIAGFLVDAGIVAILSRKLEADPVVAQGIAFTIAVTVTWLINRNWTFSKNASERWLNEWTRYVAANSVGAIVNNGVYVFLVLCVSEFSKEPVFAVAAGSIAGMGFNFASSKLIVFKIYNQHYQDVR
jgi:putative flippase GtrA